MANSSKFRQQVEAAAKLAREGGKVTVDAVAYSLDINYDAARAVCRCAAETSRGELVYDGERQQGQKYGRKLLYTRDEWGKLQPQPWWEGGPKPENAPAPPAPSGQGDAPA